MRHFMGNDWLDHTQVILDGHVVATPGVDVHATTERELTGIGVVERDVVVIALVVIEDKQQILAHRWHASDAIEQFDHSLERAPHVFEGGTCNIGFQR